MNTFSLTVLLSATPLDLDKENWFMRQEAKDLWAVRTTVWDAGVSESDQLPGEALARRGGGALEPRRLRLQSASRRPHHLQGVRFPSVSMGPEDWSAHVGYCWLCSWRCLSCSEIPLHHLSNYGSYVAQRWQVFLIRRYPGEPHGSVYFANAELAHTMGGYMDGALRSAEDTAIKVRETVTCHVIDMDQMSILGENGGYKNAICMQLVGGAHIYVWVLHNIWAFTDETQRKVQSLFMVKIFGETLDLVLCFFAGYSLFWQSGWRRPSQRYVPTYSIPTDKLRWETSSKCSAVLVTVSCSVCWDGCIFLRHVLGKWDQNMFPMVAMFCDIQVKMRHCVRCWFHNTLWPIVKRSPIFARMIVVLWKVLQSHDLSSSRLFSLEKFFACNCTTAEFRKGAV